MGWGGLKIESFKYPECDVVVEVNIENDVEEKEMNDYVEELEDAIDSVVKVVRELEDEGELANIGMVIKKTKKKNIKNRNTSLRDAIMVAVGEGKLKIRKNPPNQLLLESYSKEK